MKTNPIIQELPDDARAVIEELAGDRAVESIWLIGSRANCRAKPTSDWDFLVFSSVEPVHVAERREGIDLLRLGPSGQGHADVIDDRRASHIGKKLISYEPLVARGNDPVFDFLEDVAYLIHEKCCRDVARMI